DGVHGSPAGAYGSGLPSSPPPQLSAAKASGRPVGWREAGTGAAARPAMPLPLLEHHCALLFAVVMIGRHNFISARCNAPDAAGACWPRGQTSGRDRRPKRATGSRTSRATRFVLASPGAAITECAQALAWWLRGRSEGRTLYGTAPMQAALT